MIYSMTGYGRREFPLKDRNVIIEIRSLNGKNLELNCKLNNVLRPYETEFRKIIQEHLVRGSVECSIHFQSNGGSKPVSINTALAKYYYQAIATLADELSLNKDNVLQTVLALPDVIAADTFELNEEDYELIKAQLLSVVEELTNFRKQEGLGLQKDLLTRNAQILSGLHNIANVDGERVTKIRDRVLKSLQDIGENINIDQNRLEQELIYYVEKIDISEEKQRLSQHCRLFQEMLEQDNSKGIGKKLNFVLQEMGREINTLGSKAYDADIQKVIIGMKDELEKAKEQSLNVL